MPEVFHHPRETDAINLELRKGTWRCTLCGCDSSGSWGGTLVQVGAEIILKPRSPEETFRWVGLPPCASVKQVTLSREPDGSLWAMGESQTDKRCGRRRSAKFKQRWDPGQVCAVCEGMLQPSDIRPCDGGEGDPCGPDYRPQTCSGSPCHEKQDCCSGETCYQGKCCQQVGGRCWMPSDCCTGDCDDEKCQCAEPHGFCVTSADCCSGTCKQSVCQSGDAGQASDGARVRKVGALDEP